MMCVWYNQNSHIIHLSQGYLKLFAHVKYQLSSAIIQKA